MIDRLIWAPKDTHSLLLPSMLPTSHVESLWGYLHSILMAFLSGQSMVLKCLTSWGLWSNSGLIFTTFWDFFQGSLTLPYLSGLISSHKFLQLWCKTLWSPPSFTPYAHRIHYVNNAGMVFLQPVMEPGLPEPQLHGPPCIDSGENVPRQLFLSSKSLQ